MPPTSFSRPTPGFSWNRLLSFEAEYSISRPQILWEKIHSNYLPDYITLDVLLGHKALQERDVPSPCHLVKLQIESVSLSSISVKISIYNVLSSNTLGVAGSPE